MNYSNTKRAPKSVSVNLKDGTSVTIRGNETFTVKGKVVFSHILTPLSPEEIERTNKLRDKWAKSGDGPYYKENSMNSYGLITLEEVSIVNNGQLTDTERFAMDHFYESQKHFGIKRMQLKNYTATVSTGMYKDDKIIPCTFDDELEKDQTVFCSARLYLTKSGRPAIALTEVISVGEPVYLDRSKYQKKTVAA